MCRHYLLAAALLLAAAYCSPTPSPQGSVIAVRENKKHKVRCVFYGEEVGAGAGSVTKVIRGVALRNEDGEEARYTPPDDASSGDPSLYSTDVWSPDEEYLALPRGRFKGFCIMKASAAFESVKAGRCDDSIMVREKNETGLWHEFAGWDGAHLTFRAGLSGDLFTFKYDVPRQRLTTTGRASASVEGENRSGKLSVEEH